jgi:hypothetical protein
MGSVAEFERPHPTARSRRRRRLAAVGAGAAFVVAAVVLVAVVWRGPSGSSSTSGTLGPYTLNDWNTTLLQLSFPHCSIVEVHWYLKTGVQAAFTIWTPAVVQPSNCTGAPPTENLTCPLQGCPVYSGQAVCIIVAAAGTCSFMSTQTNYTFLLYTPYCKGSVTLLFTATYSASLAS